MSTATRDNQSAATKANQVNHIRRFLDRRFGDDAFARVVAELDPQHREVLGPKLDDSSWVEAVAYVHLFVKADEVLGRGDFRLCEDMGHSIAKVSVPRLYKVFIRLGNPGFVLQQTSTFWEQVHSYGRLERAESGSNYAVLRLHDHVYPHKAFCTGLCGFFRGILELCGATSIEAKEVKCVLDGDDYCEFRGSWL